MDWTYINWSQVIGEIAMSDQKQLKNLKVGDEVFVVPQIDSHRRCRGEERQGSHLPVVKVGRQYGYIRRHYKEEPFCLKNGHSHHPDGSGNQRANGWGFDVFVNELDWIRFKEDSEQRKLLGSKFNRCYFIDKLPEGLAEKINKLLEEVGL
jgi:hypothetical protein